MLLNNEGKIEFLKTKFHQYIDIALTEDETLNEDNIHQFVNFVLPIQKINEYLDFDSLEKFFNEDFNNVIFTPKDSSDEIYSYECYQKVFFIKMKPFSKNIRMHIIPKKYDASDSVLFFKDSKQKISSSNFKCTTAQYKRKTNENNVNLYYKKDSVEPSCGTYKFKIKDFTRNMKNLQINMGYSYNDTNPSDVITHYTGILDVSDENGKGISSSRFTEFNSSLIDVNCTNIPDVGDYTDEIWQATLETVQHTSDTNWSNFQICEGGLTNQHTTNTLYHKTLKYFNDTLYIEENNQYHIAHWNELR